MIMDIAFYQALKSAGIADDKAQAAVEALNHTLDDRYKLQSGQLATKTDMVELRAEVKTDMGQLRQGMAQLETRIVREMRSQTTWMVGAMVALVSAAIAILRLTS